MISIQGTLVIPIKEVASAYITMNRTSKVIGRSAPSHIVRIPSAIHIVVRKLPAITNTGILRGIGSTTREIKT